MFVWTIQPYVAKCGSLCIIMSWSVMWKNCSPSHTHIFWTAADPFALKLGVWRILLSLSCVIKKGGSFGQGQFPVKLQHLNECFSRQYLLNYGTFYYQTLYSDALSWAGVKRLVCCLQGQGHSEGLYFMLKLWLSTIFSELLIFLLPNLVQCHKLNFFF